MPAATEIQLAPNPGDDLFLRRVDQLEPDGGRPILEARPRRPEQVSNGYAESRLCLRRVENDGQREEAVRRRCGRVLGCERVPIDLVTLGRGPAGLRRSGNQRKCAGNPQESPERSPLDHSGNLIRTDIGSAGVRGKARSWTPIKTFGVLIRKAAVWLRESLGQRLTMRTFPMMRCSERTAWSRTATLSASQ